MEQLSYINTKRDILAPVHVVAGIAIIALNDVVETGREGWVVYQREANCICAQKIGKHNSASKVNFSQNASVLLR